MSRKTAYEKRMDAQKRRRNLKQDLVDRSGGACILCGYQKCLSAMEFHHIDSSKKDVNVSGFASLEKALKEIEHCVLLCANCHREVHDGFHPSLILSYEDY